MSSGAYLELLGKFNVEFNKRSEPLYGVDVDSDKPSLSGLPQKIHVLPHSVLKIGRSSRECRIVVHDVAISSVHCLIWVIIFDEASVPMYYIRDSSLNGTFINGVRLGKGQVYLLQDGDLIELCEGSGRLIKFNNNYIHKTNNQQVKLHSLKYETIVDHWEVTSRIVGCGTFGYVLVAYKNKDKAASLLSTPYAVKIVKMKPTKLDKEAKILMQLDHPNIIKVFKTHLDQNNNLYIFQELIPGGDLFSYLAKGDCLIPVPQTDALIFVYQILHALNYLHSKGIVHRDLKLDNILLCSPEPHAKIVLADFGIAKTISSRKGRMFTVVGTPEYCAPEVGFKADRKAYHSFFRAATLEQQGYDSKCDLWSLGVITHIMLTGISPFYGDGTEQSIIQQAKLGKLNFQIEQWNNIDASAKHFVAKLLEVNVEKRLDCDKCFKHSWISKHNDKLREIYYKKILAKSYIDAAKNNHLAEPVMKKMRINNVEKETIR
ncbi:Meiosis-specific serine/threonine-protein kinase MEK1 [Nakaseomyces bracarensis]|uniref:Meiosis-specific serine/threonine-protein kinase MEK1 n=1 Tax=Nakaseomyces bracarensis TaxID=273131 RepID=A0ABR4NVP4_9SACH